MLARIVEILNQLIDYYSMRSKGLCQREINIHIEIETYYNRIIYMN
jgi:hypothetical protein